MGQQMKRNSYQHVPSLHGSNHEEEQDEEDPFGSDRGGSPQQRPSLYDPEPSQEASTTLSQLMRPSTGNHEEEEEEMSRFLTDEEDVQEKLNNLRKDVWKDTPASKKERSKQTSSTRTAASSIHSFSVFKVWGYLLMVMAVVTGSLYSWHKGYFRIHLQTSIDDDDDDAFVMGSSRPATEGATLPTTKAVQYDPTAALHMYNPFHFGEEALVVEPPRMPQSKEEDDDEGLGFLMQPSVHNGTLVFVSEGDLYLTHLSTANNDNKNDDKAVAMKLTTTVGNVRTPVLNPVYPYYVAYTATYTGRRELYLLDLRAKKRPATRLTYWDQEYGISRVVGWKDEGQTLVFCAHTRDATLPDVRLYQLALAQPEALDEKETKKSQVSAETPKKTPNDANKNKSHVEPEVAPEDGTSGGGRILSSSSHGGPLRIMQVQPLPLAQAIDGAYDASQKCLYFTRFSQSSRTIRYVGGTAESLWAHCHGRPRAVSLTSSYRGTDKAPAILTLEGTEYLLFLSDRFLSHKEGGNATWVAASMNLWAIQLPSEQTLYAAKRGYKQDSPTYVQLTNVACQFNGMSLVEYSLDSATNSVVLRIGADLHRLSAEVIQEKLEAALKPPGRRAKRDKQIQNKPEIEKLPIVVYSDFHQHQERLLKVSLAKHLTSLDVFSTAFGSTSVLMGLRGQLFVAPVIPDIENMHPYAGAGMNLPPRRYRVAPGITTGGAVRILKARHVPQFREKTARRVALVLATDPKSDTAEHGFYLMEIQSDSAPSFVDLEDLPDPFLGGSLSGGSVKDGGLGSVDASSIRVSPCGRRLAWTDKDGRICVATLPPYKDEASPPYVVLPQENELGQPLLGDQSDLSWSPGGRYLAITHHARNQFNIISIVDCGDPERNGPETVADVDIGRIVQATPDRFNSGDVVWGKAALDFKMAGSNALLSKIAGLPEQSPSASSTLYFLSDRDVITDVRSPWGTRAPSAHFAERSSVYALPLVSEEDEDSLFNPSHGMFPGGGAAELWSDNILAMEELLKAFAPKEASTDATEGKDGTKRNLLAETLLAASVAVPRRMEKSNNVASSPSQAPSVEEPVSPFPVDRPIRFGSSDDLEFARRAFRMGNIPPGKYVSILGQAIDDPSLVLLEETPEGLVIKMISIGDFPTDTAEPVTVQIPGRPLLAASLSTTREYLALVFAPGTAIVVPASAQGLGSLVAIGMNPKGPTLSKGVVDTDQLALSIWPSLEYQQIYDDAWRMLRDYFYDTGMNGVDWPQIHSRYRSLIKRCAKREEVDDVLAQMASELSALHVFVYGGEYDSPLHNDVQLDSLHEIASLGATFDRSAEWKGYVVTSIPERDPDFNLKDNNALYSPLSDRSLRLSGQRGLKVGDVIVGVNGESVMRVPDMHMLLRGTAGRSVRLEVLRLASALPETTNNTEGRRQAESTELVPEPLIVVPLDPRDAGDLRYEAWEWKTKQSAKQLAQEAGFSVGYVHLRSMSGPQDMDAFVRGFYPDYDKEALIIDVRHNRGGNIDSWLLDILQRKAWMYWQSRTRNITTGGLGWDEQFAFRGHLVVLIDEHTSSDGEGFSRGVSELGLGKLVGTRTWGGGIWLASDNHLVDGGIATAPEIGTYNDKFGWGLGIEQVGVSPDVEVDNDPHVFYNGKDEQLERAIQVLEEWLKQEPVVFPKSPGPKRDMSMPAEALECNARR